MALSKTVLLFVCYLIGIIGSFLLLIVLPTYRGWEFALLIIGILAMLITLLGTAVNARWAYPLSTILATLAIANSTLLYVIIGRYFLTYTLTLLALTLALIISISNIGTGKEDGEETITEQTPEPPQKKKRGRPKKNWNPKTDMKLFRE